MAEKSNEELLDALETAISKVYGHDDMPAYRKARAAVLARMAGPGEVVVPVAQIEEWKAQYVAEVRGAEHGDSSSFDLYLAARPNEGLEK